MDHIDEKVLRILQEDGRISMTKLGQMVNLSTPAVTERVRKLEGSGVIEGYRAIVNPEKLNKSFTGFILFETKKMLAFQQVCQQSPIVMECHRVTGQYCYIVKIVAESIHEVEAFIDEVSEYSASTTLINFSSPVKFKAI
ncbi:Lrp/AsnC family transcriptional regulator [Paenibacillus arenosi]|uniref:Lrp/AsnC family transcriptional regulator n=1 Tax=Paenibacillus arenosi TaxID=2774142 RepID=A0ABR9AW71_9BACL|nr:Lrp/AsnC family transcriptional regulator [Paenibacillus arenosi]MBD8498131.1 Lrp/AsnC family transcriptional regulator [Paenibacillus arenosi]